MKIRTKIDEHKNLTEAIMRLIGKPVGEKFEELYNKLVQVILSNLDNKDELLLLYSENINVHNDRMSSYLKLASEKEKAYFNMGRFSALCNLIKNLDDYDKALQNYLQPFLNLSIGDVVYVKNNGILHKTIVINKKNNEIQTKYGKRWFTQNDYLDYIFPSQEEIDLYKNGLNEYYDCDKCKGFRQGKCAYGYSVDTYHGFLYKNNTKYKVLKGTPKELCCKNTKD